MRESKRKNSQCHLNHKQTTESEIMTYIFTITNKPNK